LRATVKLILSQISKNVFVHGEPVRLPTETAVLPHKPHQEA